MTNLDHFLANITKDQKDKVPDYVNKEDLFSGSQFEEPPYENDEICYVDYDNGCPLCPARVGCPILMNKGEDKICSNYWFEWCNKEYKE